MAQGRLRSRERFRASPWQARAFALATVLAALSVVASQERSAGDVLEQAAPYVADFIIIFAAGGRR